MGLLLHQYSCLMYNPLNPQSAAFSSNRRTWPPKAVLRTHFGQRVLWHAVQDGGRHVSANELEAYRLIGDPAVDHIFALRRDEGRPVMAGDDLLAMAMTARNDATRPASERALYDLYRSYARIPSWVHRPALARGQDVYLAYLPAISLSLYYRSLVPGFSIPRIAAVLQSTGYLAPPASRQEVRNRLLDTGSLLLQSLGSLEDILPGGDGWKTCLQVRFLHAKVRHGLLRRQGNRAWDIDKLGIPINEEDMNATLLAFSVNPILGVEMLLGFPMPMRDRLDYLALWRYLGWLLGVPVATDDVCQETDETADHVGETNNRNGFSHYNNTTRPRIRRDPSLPRPLDPCGPGWISNRANPIEHAYAVFQSIVLHLLHPNKLSVKISHHLLRQGRTKDASPQTRAGEQSWFYYRALQCRRFVGDPLADALELPLHKTRFQRWRQWTVSTAILLMWTMYTWAGLPWSPLRFILIRCHRYYLVKFAQTWQTAHTKRMQEKLATGEQRACPFAMVNPPVY